jgi:NADP-dependent 3-hydroxy acid dehydrogenase YdfG
MQTLQRIALVTGASSGIGAATARSLAAAGMAVALVARRRDRLDEIAAEIAQAGGKAFVLTADLTKEAEAQRIVIETEDHFGRLDVLVNNAGVMYLEPVDTASLERWRDMFDLNVMSMIASTQAALPGMRARFDGHIVNISSTAGRFSLPNSGGYSATKFAVGAFSESLRKEVFKDNIRVTVIEPGVTETELREHIAHPGIQQSLNTWADSMRQLQSDDIASIITFCVTRPAHVNINEVLVRPTDQER